MAEMKQFAGMAYAVSGESIFQMATPSYPVRNRNSEEEAEDQTSNHVPWGQNDDFPLSLVTDINKDTVLAPGIRMNSAIDYGGGIAHGEIKLNDNGQETFVNKRVGEVVSFIRACDLERQLSVAFYDVRAFGWCIPQFTLSKDRKKIARLSFDRTRAKWCRLGKRTSDGWFSSIYINPDFGSRTDQTPARIPVLPDYDAVSWLKEQAAKAGGASNFVLPRFLHDTGNQYYPLPDWNTARESKWVEISKQIALFKSYLMENQFTIKYHIKVHPDYWPLRHGKEEWAKLSIKEQNTKMQEEVDRISEFMKGAKGAGNNLMTSVGTQPGDPSRVFDHITITELGNKFSKDGTYIEDSREATEHKLSALLIHPDIIGNAPGSKLGSGSGSGSRVAFNQKVALSKMVQDLVLYPLYIIAEFNEWPDYENLVYRMRQSLITTLDTGGEMTKPEA